MGPPTELSMGLKVSNLFLANSTEWDLEKIREICPFDEEKILKIKASKVGTSDKLCWHGTKSGELTTKSGYHAAFAASNDAENLQLEGNWNKEVWNLQTAPKTGHIHEDPHCKRCGEPESIIHLFFQCEFAKAVWQAAPFSEEIDYSRMIDLRALWNLVRTKPCLPPTCITTDHLAPWIMWSLWTTRNRLVFSNIKVEAEEFLSKGIIMAREWQQGHVKNPKTHKTGLPPPINAVDSILKTDAAWSVTASRAGLRWIISRNANTTTYSRI
ncbi:hypothetical protein YC2023_036865 [Brassica napus]